MAKQLLIFKADILLKQEVSAKNALDVAIELANATKTRLSQAPDPPPRAIQRLRKCCGLDISHVGDEHGNAGHVESLVHNMAIKHEIANGVLAALDFLEQHEETSPKADRAPKFSPPKFSLRERFGLGDTKYDEQIERRRNRQDFHRRQVLRGAGNLFKKRSSSGLSGIQS